MDETAPLNAHIQRQLRLKHLSEVELAEAFRWLVRAGLLPEDNKSGASLRRRARQGLIHGAEQRPPRRYGRWFIGQVDG